MRCGNRAGGRRKGVVGDAVAIDAVGCPHDRTHPSRRAVAVGGLPQLDGHSPSVGCHAAGAGGVRRRCLPASPGRSRWPAPLDQGRRWQRVRWAPRLPGRRPDAAYQLATIDPGRRTAGQRDVGRSRHARGTDDRRHGRPRHQRGDRRSGVESRRHRARRRSDRRALRRREANGSRWRRSVAASPTPFPRPAAVRNSDACSTRWRASNPVARAARAQQGVWPSASHRGVA